MYKFCDWIQFKNETRACRPKCYPWNLIKLKAITIHQKHPKAFENRAVIEISILFVFCVPKDVKWKGKENSFLSMLRKEWWIHTVWSLASHSFSLLCHSWLRLDWCVAKGGVEGQNKMINSYPPPLLFRVFF